VGVIRCERGRQVGRLSPSQRRAPRSGRARGSTPATRYDPGGGGRDGLSASPLVAIELVALALVTAIRPTSLGAIYALLSGPAPRRLMSAYVLAGVAFTVSFGLIVIWAFQGININAGSSTTRAIAEIAGGIAALGVGVLVLTGRIHGPHLDATPKQPGRWTDLLSRHLTVRNAAIAGPATHIPGLFYLIALNLIVAAQPKVAEGVLYVVIYNAVWFCLAIGALAICIFRPDSALDVVGAVQAWARSHARTIILVLWFAIGSVLLIRGLVAL
jgi:hypothetical protein